MLAHYSHCLCLVLFATGEGRGKTAKRKTAKVIVSVFFSGSQGSHVWLAGSHIGHTPLQLGPTFGRKLMNGYLDMQTQRTFASEGRIRKSLSRVAPLYHHQRQRRAERQINPQPYMAEYHGHKLHMDQNEKLVNYRVVHVCAVDGFSRFIPPSFACMPTKNNVLIYEHLYRWVECGNLRV